MGEPPPETLRAIVNACVPGGHRIEALKEKSKKSGQRASHSGKSAALCVKARSTFCPESRKCVEFA
jgi:hypothetical protein